MQKIYTKTGDEGESGLIGGSRLKKDEPVFWALGTLDELNALLGSARSGINAAGKAEYDQLIFEIERLQFDIFQIGSEITEIFSGMTSAAKPIGERLHDFEMQIDAWSGLLPELGEFILPGGSVPGAALHQARTVCRRAERELVALGREKELRREIYAYFNRLGDWLFMAARYVNRLEGESERGLRQ